MDGKALVTRIAFLVIGFSLLSVIVWGFFVGSRGMVGNIVGIVVNVVLAFFLIAGHGGARWFMAIRCGFGTILSFAPGPNWGTRTLTFSPSFVFGCFWSRFSQPPSASTSCFRSA